MTAAEATARDAAAIEGGIPSRALMERAGAAAAAEIARRFAPLLETGVHLFAGPGNNGGDAWVVARALAATGVRVRVSEPVEARTADARAERALALSLVRLGPWQGERVVVDGLLGTGSAGAPHGAIANAAAAISDARRSGATVVALDLPTGLDATTGEAAPNAVVADLTLTFGTVKRGHLVARGRCGSIVVLDIGLGAFAELADGAPAVADGRWVADVVPSIPAESHKGTRKKLAIIGGAEGMAGAAVLAARAAMRSGIGMVRLVVAPESLAAVQAAEPFALAAAWPDDDATLRRDVVDWADVLVLGPGLGRSPAALRIAERALLAFRGPALLDADALNAFDGRLDDLSTLVGGRAALLTPHPAEFARLAGTTVDDVLARRYDIGRELARRVSATVLLKGLPTVVTAPDGRCMVSAAGTPTLAAAGSGDILSGIAGTLLAQTGDALVAGAAGAWVHGTAAERDAERAGRDTAMDADLDPDLDEALGDDVELGGADAGVLRTSRPASRGHTLADVLESLPSVWAERPRLARYPVLLELPVVGDAL